MAFESLLKRFFCFERRIPLCFDFDLLVFFEIDHVLKIEMVKKMELAGVEPASTTLLNTFSTSLDYLW